MHYKALTGLLASLQCGTCTVLNNSVQFICLLFVQLSWYTLASACSLTRSMDLFAGFFICLIETRISEYKDANRILTLNLEI